jgi:hypothetical protein
MGNSYNTRKSICVYVCENTLYVSLVIPDVSTRGTAKYKNCIKRNSPGNFGKIVFIRELSIITNDYAAYLLCIYTLVF